MAPVLGSLKTNKLVLQGHPGENVTLDVQQNEFTMSMGSEVLMTVASDGLEGSNTGEVDSKLTISKETTFEDEVTVQGNLTVGGNMKMTHTGSSVVETHDMRMGYDVLGGRYVHLETGCPVLDATAGDVESYFNFETLPANIEELVDVEDPVYTIYPTRKCATDLNDNIDRFGVKTLDDGSNVVVCKGSVYHGYGQTVPLDLAAKFSSSDLDRFSRSQNAFIGPTKKYRNFIMSVQYKWKTDADNKIITGDSGVLFRGTQDKASFVAFVGYGPPTVTDVNGNEVTVNKSDPYEADTMKGPQFDVPGGAFGNVQGNMLYDETFNGSRFALVGPDKESKEGFEATKVTSENVATGDGWNTLTLKVSDNERYTAWVNGVFAWDYTEKRIDALKDYDIGAICFQCHSAAFGVSTEQEIYYKNLLVKPLPDDPGQSLITTSVIRSLDSNPVEVQGDLKVNGVSITDLEARLSALESN